MFPYCLNLRKRSALTQWGNGMNVLFDLDGTLLDTAPDFAHVLNQLRSENHLPALSLTEVRPMVTNGLPSLLSTGLGVNAEHPDYPSLSQRFLSLYHACLGDYADYFLGIPELLSSLEEHRIPWSIVTNKAAWLTLPLLQKFHLTDRAACIVSGDTTLKPKPHPDPLWHACTHMSVDPHRCVFVGDAERDIVAGKAAGMSTIGALFGYISDIDEALQWQADHYVYYPNEIWPWIANKL